MNTKFRVPLTMILEALRTQTAASHRNVEASLLMQPIGNRTLTRENYTLILRKFYGFFQPLEIKIKQIPQLEYYLPDLSERRQAHRIISDLNQVTDMATAPENIPLCLHLPSITNPSEALGALYVLEGSTLGGKFISKIILETLGFTPASGTAFFSGYGAETGLKWKKFQEALVTYITGQPAQEAAVIAAADDTFRKLEQWFKI